MNYISQIRAFYDVLSVKQLSAGQIALWHALMDKCNRCGWPEWFTVANIMLESSCSLSRKGIFDSRNSLKQAGLIDFRSNGTKATAYHIITLYSTQDSTQVTTQDSTQVTTQDTATLLKPKTSKPKDNTAQLPSKKEIDAVFESVWALYPCKKGKAHVSDATKRKLFGVGIDVLSRCIDRYKADKPDWQDYQHGSTFLNGGYVDYLDENYTPPAESGGQWREL